MKLLLVHNFYRSSLPSGENEVFRLEEALLKSKGENEVDISRQLSDDLLQYGVLGHLAAALITPYNPLEGLKYKALLETKPKDVVHVHNTFPIISPSIFKAIGGSSARVLTLHNYRIFCPAGIPLRNGKICVQCMDKKSVMPALAYGCYKESRLATIPLALKVWLHRALGTWRNEVDAFICLSEFQRDLMIQSGLPADKVHVKPNFYPGNPKVVPWEHRKPYIVFAGRLSPEKGLISLLKAWQLWGTSAPELRIVGEGEQRQKLESLAQGLPVRFFGQMTSEEAQLQIANARLLILPSEWFEGFPMVIREAFAFGTPVAVSNIGPLPTIVSHGKNGIVFKPANPTSLKKNVRKVWENQGLLERLGLGARSEFEAKYTEEANYKILMDIYQKATKENKKYKDCK